MADIGAGGGGYTAGVEILTVNVEAGKEGLEGRVAVDEGGDVDAPVLDHRTEGEEEEGDERDGEEGGAGGGSRLLHDLRGGAEVERPRMRRRRRGRRRRKGVHRGPLARAWISLSLSLRVRLIF